MNRYATAIARLVLIMMPLGQIGIDIYMPSLPYMASSLHTTHNMVQLSVTMYLFSLGAALFFSGPFADAYGRYRLIVGGLLCYIISAFFAAMTHSIVVLIFLRLFQGFGAGTVITSIRASVSDAFDGDALVQVVAKMTIAWSLGPIVAPFIGGYLQEYVGWRANFMFMVVYGICVIVPTLFLLGETLTPKLRQPIHVRKLSINFMRILTHRQFIGYIATMTMAYAYIIFFNVTAPFLLQTELGMPPARYGQVLLLVGIAYLFGTILNRLCIRRFNADKLIVFGVMMGILASLCQTLLSLMGIFTVLSVVLPAFVVFIGIGFIYGNALASAMNLFRDIAGPASSLLGFIPMAGCAAVSVLAARLPETSPLPFAAISTAMLLLALIINLAFSHLSDSSLT